MRRNRAWVVLTCTLLLVGLTHPFAAQADPVPGQPTKPVLTNGQTSRQASLATKKYVTALRQQAAATGAQTISYAQVEGWWIAAGGSKSSASTAAAIAQAESASIPGRIQQNQPYSTTGWGLWQITAGNSVSRFGVDYQMLDPWNNAEASISKWKANGFQPWTTYNNGAYKQFLQNVNPTTPTSDPGQFAPDGSAPSGTTGKATPGKTFGPPLLEATNGGSFVRVGGTYHGVQVAANGHVSQLVWDGSKWYRQDLGGNAAGTAAIVYHDGSYNVFALSPSGDLYQDRYDSGGSGWTGFYRDGSVTFTARSGVSAIYADGEYRVFGIGPGGHVFQSFYSDAWHSQDLGGSAVGTPGVTYVNGRYDVFVVGPSGALYQDRYDAGGSGWTGFYGTSGVTFAKTGGVSAVYADGAYRVYGVGPSGDVYQSYYSDGWHSQDLGGTAVGTPSITYADGRYDLYATTAANNVFQDTYTNSWTGWHQIASAP